MNPERSAYGMIRGHDIGDFADKLIDLQLERHAWIGRASRQIREWKEDDARNGQPWGEEPKHPRETRAAEKAAGHKSSGH